MTVVLHLNGLPTRPAAPRHLRRGQLKRIANPPVRCARITASRSPTQRRRVGSVLKPKNSRSTKVHSLLGFISYASPSREFFDAAIHSLVGGSAMICFALAFVPLLTYEEDGKEQTEVDDMETIKWSVAGVVSCFPYFNWASWVFIASDSEVPLPYYFLSALYLIPTLESGFHLDPFSVFMLILGILHMQVERVAQTEPAILGSAGENRLELPDIVKQFSQTIKEQIPDVVSKSAAQLTRLSRKEDSVTDLVDRAYAEKQEELRDAADLAKLEQQFWDKELNEKNAKK